jgi:hypothetical protein
MSYEHESKEEPSPSAAALSRPETCAVCGRAIYRRAPDTEHVPWLHTAAVPEMTEDHYAQPRKEELGQ